jgi:protein-tyrosine phosphatase
MPSETEQKLDAVFQVSMVCTGNICRSPMAEIVFRSLVEKAGLSRQVQVSSAGTGDWHVGERADPRTVIALSNRGFDGEGHRAKQFDASKFDDLDLILALDRTHERAIRSYARTDDDRSKIRLLTSFDPELAQQVPDVPDPYYADAAVFDSTLALIERACQALFWQLEPAFRAPIRTTE